MSTHHRILAVGLCGALWWSATVSCNEIEGPRLVVDAARDASVLLITLDTTRSDRLGCYGAVDPATPNLDELAARAFRFTHAVTPAPTTLPAHASLMTGLYPPSHGARVNGETRLDGSALTLAEILGRRGWRTAAFVSAFVLDARYGLGQGFEIYDDRVDSTDGPTFAAGTNERDARATTEAALEWVSGLESGEPFFLWVHYFDAHAPYHPPAPFDTRFAGRPYDGEIAFIDSQIGRLLARLHELKREKSTLIVVVGDHGESLGEHRESTHGLFLYDSTVRVPLLVSLPGQRQSVVVDDRLVSLVDLLPTTVDLLGVDLPIQLDGRSFAGVPPEPDRAVYAETMVPFVEFGWSPLFSLRRLGDKVIRAPRPEYYRLDVDEDERNNLWAETETTLARRRNELATDLAGRLARWPDPSAAAPASVTGEERARLEALGYLVGDGGGAAPPAGRSLDDPKDMVVVSEALIAANARLAGGDAAGALSAIEAAARIDGADPSVHYARAKALLRLGRLVEAEQALRVVRGLRPRADASILLAQILILDGRTDEASGLLDEAADLDPRHGGVLIARGDLLLRLGRPAEAKAVWEEARAIDPYRAAGTAAARLGSLCDPSRQPEP